MAKSVEDMRIKEIPKEELWQLETKEIINLILKTNSQMPSMHGEDQTYRDYLSGIVRYKLAESEEKLSNRIWWLNFILIGLTVIMIAIPFIRFLNQK